MIIPQLVNSNKDRVTFGGYISRWAGAYNGGLRDSRRPNQAQGQSPEWQEQSALTVSICAIWVYLLGTIVFCYSWVLIRRKRYFKAGGQAFSCGQQSRLGAESFVFGCYWHLHGSLAHPVLVPAAYRTSPSYVSCFLCCVLVCMWNVIQVHVFYYLNVDYYTCILMPLG